MQSFIPEISEQVSRVYRCCKNSDVQGVADALYEYYKQGKKSPSVAQIVYNDTFQKYDEMYINLMRNKIEHLREEYERFVDNIERNIIKAENVEPVCFAKQDFEEEFWRLYSRSGCIREKLIDDERIILGKTLKKADFMYKLNIWFFKHKHGIHKFFK